MNINKLKKTAAKEFTRSPGKSITLLLLCPVALYFCAPLFRGLLPQSNKASVASSDMTASPFLLQIPKETEVGAVDEKPDWRKVVDWLEADQLAVSAEMPAGMRSPFRLTNEPTLVEHSERIDEADQARPQPNAQDVRDLFKNRQLVLTTTMVGSRHRMATINRTMFSEGDSIPVAVATENGTELYQLVLTRVERYSVVLTHGEEAFTVELQNRLPKNAIVVQPAANGFVE